MKLLRTFRCPTHRITLTALAAVLVLAGAPAGAVQDAKAARYYEDALTRYEKRDVAGAIIQLKNALQIDRNMLPVQMLLGKALSQNGEAAQAEIAFTEAIRLGVNRSEVVVPLAQAMIAQGKLKSVLDQPQFAPAGLPTGVKIQMHLLRAGAHADLGDMRTAFREIEEARALDPRSADAWLAEVPLRIRARQLREALAAVDRAQALAPSAADGWYQRGAVQHVTGDLRAALESYTKALAADTLHTEARVARAGLYIDFGRLPEADKDVQVLREQSPLEPRGAYLAALLAERKQDPNAARAALREVTELLDPVPIEYIRYRPQMLLLNGIAHFSLDEREKAKPYLELLQRAQSNTASSKLLAQIYLNESNVPRAVEVLESYVKAQPNDAQAMALLASAHMAQGRHARAATLMQSALQTSDAPELRTALGLSLVGMGQSGNAIAELENAFKRSPNQTRAGAALVGLYLRDKQTQKANEVADVLVKQQPSNASFFNLQGLARAQANRHADARAAYEQALKLDGGLQAAKLNLARLDIATQAWDAAANRLNAMLKANEKDTEAMLEMASMAARRGQREEAQRWLEKANDVAGPKNHVPGLALVDSYLRTGRAAPALEASKKLASKAPDDLIVQIMHARALLANNDLATAKATLNGATRFAEFNPQAQYEIASLQLAAGNLPGAAYSLEKALSGQPNFLPAQVLLATVEMRQGDTPRAEKRAREVIEKAPKKAVGYSLLGDIALSRGQLPAAVDAYRRAHQTEPSSSTMQQLVRASSVQDGGKQAFPLAEQWVKANPKDLGVRKALANGYARAGNLTQARAGYEGILAQNPKDADALNNLANIHLRQKDPATAVRLAEQAMALAPADANVIDTLGWALYQAKQPDRALQLLRDARLRQPSNPEIRYHLATVLAQSGRKTEAREELEAALKTKPAFEGAAEAEQLLATLR